MLKKVDWKQNLRIHQHLNGWQTNKTHFCKQKDWAETWEANRRTWSLQPRKKRPLKSKDWEKMSMKWNEMQLPFWIFFLPKIKIWCFSLTARYVKDVILISVLTFRKIQCTECELIGRMIQICKYYFFIAIIIYFKKYISLEGTQINQLVSCSLWIFSFHFSKLIAVSLSIFVMILWLFWVCGYMYTYTN